MITQREKLKTRCYTAIEKIVKKQLEMANSPALLEPNRSSFCPAFSPAGLDSLSSPSAVFARPLKYCSSELAKWKLEHVSQEYARRCQLRDALANDGGEHSRLYVGARMSSGGRLLGGAGSNCLSPLICERRR